jgi:polysaccharide pyruvyl transferase WcaK-like protein
MGTPRPADAPAPGAPRRICILNFTGERQNWGCRATSWELVRALNGHWPDSRAFELQTVPLLPHHALDVDLWRIHAAEIRTAYRASPAPSAAQRSGMLAIARARYGDLVDRVADADLVLFQGEGTMTGTDFIRADRLLLLPWVAQYALGKPVVWLNQTLFSADADFTSALLPVLAGVEHLWVREPAALAWLARHGVTHARLVPDTAFLTDPLDHGDVQAQLAGRGYFCVTGGAALFADHVPAFLDAIRAIADRTGLLPVFACSVGRDIQLADAAARAWPPGSHLRIPVGTSYQAVAHHLAQAAMLVGGRYHLLILAAIGGTPSVPLGTNTPKMHGLVELLGTRWPVRDWSDPDGVVHDAVRLASSTAHDRAALRTRVATLRDDVHGALADWPTLWMQPSTAVPRSPPVAAPAHPASMPDYGDVNRRIADLFVHPADDSPDAKYGPPPAILPQLVALTIYLRRRVEPAATFLCLRQLVESQLDAVIRQLDARWLVSICDSYADHGDPVEARNALLISTFLTWERLAATHSRWSDPTRTTSRVAHPIPEANHPLWDGLVTVHLGRGDTTCNLLARYATLLAATPHLLRIWRELLRRIRTHDSILAALDVPHGHMFDEHVSWFADVPDADIPAWRRPPPRAS